MPPIKIHNPLTSVKTLHQAHIHAGGHADTSVFFPFSLSLSLSLLSSSTHSPSLNKVFPLHSSAAPSKFNKHNPAHFRPSKTLFWKLLFLPLPYYYYLLPTYVLLQRYNTVVCEWCTTPSKQFSSTPSSRDRTILWSGTHPTPTRNDTHTHQILSFFS